MSYFKQPVFGKAKSFLNKDGGKPSVDNELAEVANDTNCSKHRDEKAQYFCLKCQSLGPFCSICCFEHSQSDHDVLNIQKAWNIIRDIQLKKSLQTRLNIAQSNIHNSYIRLNTKKRQLTDVFQFTKGNIDSIIETLCGFVKGFKTESKRYYQQQIDNISNEIGLKEDKLNTELTDILKNIEEIIQIENLPIGAQCDWFYRYCLQHANDGEENYDHDEYLVTLKNTANSLQNNLNSLRSFTEFVASQEK